MQKVTLKISTSDFLARIFSISLVRHFYVFSLAALDGNQVYHRFFDVNKYRTVNIVLDYFRLCKRNVSMLFFSLVWPSKVLPVTFIKQQINSNNKGDNAKLVEYG